MLFYLKTCILHSPSILKHILGVPGSFWNTPKKHSLQKKKLRSFFTFLPTLQNGFFLSPSQVQGCLSSSFIRSDNFLYKGLRCRVKLYSNCFSSCDFFQLLSTVFLNIFSVFQLFSSLFQFLHLFSMPKVPTLFGPDPNQARLLVSTNCFMSKMMWYLRYTLCSTRLAVYPVYFQFIFIHVLQPWPYFHVTSRIIWLDGATSSTCLFK